MPQSIVRRVGWKAKICMVAINTSRTIALVMNELTDYSYEISVGAQSLFAEQGYDCIAITGKHLDDPGSKPHNSIYQLLNTKLFAGALVYAYTLENNTELTYLPKFLAPLAPLPIVSVGAKVANYKSIVVDHEHGMTQLMDHLLMQKCYKQFLFVRGLSTNADSVLREKIFCNRLQAHGLLADAEMIDGYFDGDVVYKEMIKRFRTYTTAAAMFPTVVVCANDRMAVAAIEALEDIGLRVPEDIAVTGFDNSRECANSHVPLTTVAQPLRAMGEQAAQMLLKEMAGTALVDQIVPTHLIVRSSCGTTSLSTTISLGIQSESSQTGNAHWKVKLKQRNYLSHLATNLNIKLMEQTDLRELQAELLSLFPRLGISRCCIVLYEDGHQHIGAPARIFMAYDEATPALPEFCTTERFDSKELICPHLLQKIQSGSFCELTPLVVGAECFGYMFFAWETYYFTDFITLPVIISSALRNIYQMQSLQEYASSLAYKVEERTQELYLTNRRLQHEVHERRNSELALRAANEKLQRLASIDGLTQLANRTALDEYLSHLCAVQPESATALSMLLCDIDYFKNFNDTYGHQAGDECLQAVAQILQNFATQSTAMAARYGGEELVLLLPNVSERLASSVAEKLLHAIVTLAIPHAHSSVANHVTLSIGVITIPPHQSITVKELIFQADRALYQVKLNGRNGYASYQEQCAQPTASSKSVYTTASTRFNPSIVSSTSSLVSSGLTLR